jgi:uncharacterized surface protein with fasciclin (FAS1) repeats
MSPENASGGVRISQKEIYGMLLEIDKKVSDLAMTKIALEDHKEDTTDRLEDHETRIRIVERAVWRASALTGIISSILTAAATGLIIRLLTQ